MKSIPSASPFALAIRVLVLIAGFFAVTSHAAQTTWIGGTNGNIFGAAANWSGGAIPGSADELIFTGPNNNTSVGFSTLPATVGALTFSGAYPHYFFNGNGGALTLNGIGGDPITVADTSSGGFGTIDFNSSLNIALGANQTWTTNGNLNVNGNVSGAFQLTKGGTGYLFLGGTNSYTGGTVVNGGTLYLGQNNSSSGTITIASAGTIAAASGDLTLGNAIAAHSGATFGGPLNSGKGHIDLNGTVTVDSGSSTIQLGNTEVQFANPLAAGASSNLTFQGTGLGMAILGGTASNTNIASMTANNAAIIFTQANSIPASVQASNGGYVSVGNLGAGAPADNAVITAIGSNKATFNGIIGFDSDPNGSVPTTYSTAIDLSGFNTTPGAVRIGSVTQAVLTGNITPAGSTFDFGGYAGQGGFLVVQSDLVGGTGLTVVSPSASGGAPQNGFTLALQGNNSFAGNISLSYSSLILDRAGALPSTRTVSLGDYSYLGGTIYNAGTNPNGPFTSFNDLARRVSDNTSTSIVGIDSHDTLNAFISGSGSPSNQVVPDTNVDLTRFNSIYLGTFSGATFNVTGNLNAPRDGVLRLVNLGDIGTLELNANLLAANGVNSLVVGMPGSNGSVVLNTTAHTGIFTGGTTILGGGLRISSSDTLGSGAITVAAPVGNKTPSLGGSSGAVTLANNISFGGDFWIGTGSFDDNNNFTVGTGLTLTGTLSNNGTAGRLYIMGPSTISGTNTYSGGTYVLADTTVSSNSGLGTSFVDIGGNATLTFTSAHPSIGSLSDAGNFVSGTGTGNISLGAGVTDLTISQTSGLSYSGQISSVGAANLIKRSGNTLNLTGNNTYTGTTTINGGNLNIMGTTGQLSGTSAITVSGGTLTSGDNTNSANGRANRLNTSASITLGGTSGGGNFNLVRGATTTENQSLVSLTVSTGSNTVQANGSGNTAPTLTLSGATPYVRNAGGFVNFNNGNLTTTFTNAPSGAGNVAGTGADAILVGATLNGGNFVLAASGALTTASVTTTGTTTWTAGKNMSVNGTNGTPYAAAAVNSVKFIGSTANTATLSGTNNIASGMILNSTSGAITSTMTGGTITGGAGTDLLLINTNNSGTLSISSTIADNTSATGLTKAGSGSVNLSGTNTYTGTTTITNGTLLLGSSGALNGTPVAIYGGSSALNLNGNNTTIGGLTGTGGSVNLGSASLTVNQSTNSTFSGGLSGTGGFTKSGSGILTLNGSSSLSGATTVSGGSLLVNGSVSSSAFSVLTGATLGGSGTVGPVSVAAGGTLAPGNSPGLLTVNGNLSLLGTTMMEIAGTTRGSGGYDAVNVTGNVTFGGTLSLALLSGYNPVYGDTFDLFDWTGTQSGTFTLNLPALPAGLAWDTSQLYTAGIISIPEPGTYAAIAAVVMLGFAVWRRRQFRRTVS